MKTKLITFVAVFFAATFSSFSQGGGSPESFGNALNIGLGARYYGNHHNSSVGVNVNYEFTVAPNFTLAPSISIFSYSNNHYWGDGNKNHPYRYYNYSEIIVPIGVKGSYYFDELFQANSKWDFYAAASTGFTLISTSWESGYYGDKYAVHDSFFLFLDIHIGSEYHFNNHLGMFLDLSTGYSTLGIAIH